MTDSSPRFAKHILICALVLSLLLDIFALFGTKSSSWIVFVWFILRFASLQQLGNSAGKILKMRVEWVLQVPLNQQLNYFNGVVVSGELIGRASAIIFVYALGKALIQGQYSFTVIRNLFIILLIFWDIVSFACTISLPQDYYLPYDTNFSRPPPETLSSFDGSLSLTSTNQGDEFVNVNDFNSIYERFPNSFKVDQEERYNFNLCQNFIIYNY